MHASRPKNSSATAGVAMEGFGEPDTILNHCRGQAARPFHPI